MDLYIYLRNNKYFLHGYTFVFIQYLVVARPLVGNTLTLKHWLWICTYVLNNHYSLDWFMYNVLFFIRCRCYGIGYIYIYIHVKQSILVASICIYIFRFIHYSLVHLLIYQLFGIVWCVPNTKRSASYNDMRPRLQFVGSHSSRTEISQFSHWKVKVGRLTCVGARSSRAKRPQLKRDVAATSMCRRS